MDTPSWNRWKKMQRVLAGYDTLEAPRRKRRNITWDEQRRGISGSVARVHKLHLWWRRRLVETGDKRGMLRTAKPLLHDGQYCRQTTLHERSRIEPQTR